MLKPDSLYNEGMRPLLYSKKDSEQQGKGWHRSGSEVCYYQNQMKKKNSGFYYTLTFQIEFDHNNDEVYFAHCYPYTYSDLVKFLSISCSVSTKDRIRKT
jgi:hypothetical protein